MTLTSPNNSLQNVTQVGIFFGVILNYLTLVLINVSLIYFYSSSRKERGVERGGLCLLSPGMKTFAKWKLQNYKSDENEAYMACTSLAPFISKKTCGCQSLDGRGAHTKNNQKMPWNSQNFHFNITQKQFKKRYKGWRFFYYHP